MPSAPDSELQKLGVQLAELRAALWAAITPFCEWCITRIERLLRHV